MFHRSKKLFYHQPCNHRAGFTIVEILVSASVFVVVVVVVVNVILLFVKGPLNQSTEKELQNELDYFYQQAFQNIPWSTIDYNSYVTGINNPESELYLLSENPETTQQVSIYLNNGQIWIDDSINTPYPVTSNTIIVTKLEFYVYPQTDPFDVSGPSIVNNQPAVVVYVVAHDADDPTVELSYQSIITSRFYIR